MGFRVVGSSGLGLAARGLRAGSGLSRLGVRVQVQGFRLYSVPVSVL